MQQCADADEPGDAKQQQNQGGHEEYARYRETPVAGFARAIRGMRWAGVLLSLAWGHRIAALKVGACGLRTGIGEGDPFRPPRLRRFVLQNDTFLIEEVVNFAAVGGQVESSWDEVLPVEVRELPRDLAALDVLLHDPALPAPIADHWCAGAVSRGRPTIATDVYVRLMVVTQRTGWGYETLVREVSDSLHLRRFCFIALGERVPDEQLEQFIARGADRQADARRADTPTVSCRSSTQTPDRSAKASSASRTSSGTSPRSAR